jgi:glycerol-3-phosphate dehydrogenase
VERPLSQTPLEPQPGSGGVGDLPPSRTAGVGRPLRVTRAVERLAHERFDVLVVGGGITGAGIARDAATRGLRVALVEAGDFAQATSSASSRLIHGGIRYLQYGDFGLVFEALKERRVLREIAPHLCRPVEFVFPAYRGERPGLWALVAGVNLYNALALWRPPVAGRRLTPQDVRDLAPALKVNDLRGAALYVDCQTDDARLVLENVLDAEREGACVLSRARVTSLRTDRRGRVRGANVSCLDLEGRAAETLELDARVVVNATGPFSDAFAARRAAPLLRPTLGVHLVVDGGRLPLGGRAFVLRAPQDGRVMFALPAGRRTVIGTTDTDWTGPAGRPPQPDDPIVARVEDVAYLLRAANHAFPEAHLTEGDVISTWAGLRPLVSDRAASASATSREHLLEREPNGLLTIVGGKLTTFRRMAEDVVDQIIVALRGQGFEGAVGPCVTAQRRLPGGGPVQRSSAVELAPQVEHHLRQTYGARASALDVVLQESNARVRLSERIDPELPYLWGEVVFAARHELALDVDDVLSRRMSLSREARDGGARASETVALLLGDEHGWSRAECENAIARFHRGLLVRDSWRRDR